MKLKGGTGRVKWILTALACVIAVVSLVISGSLTAELKQGEDRNMAVWAEAIKSLNMADEHTDLTLVLKVINGNNTIPVIVLDSEGNVQTYRNLASSYREGNDSIENIKLMAETMRDRGHSIIIYMDSSYPMSLGESDSMGDREGRISDKLSSNEKEDISEQQSSNTGDFIEICYDESLMLKRLSYYPYIQLIVVVVFVFIVIVAVFASMKAEQNKVWVGLSKETAHQLGTPISSLMAWSEVLKETYPDDIFVPEMEKDIRRLERIAERFSKIGSIPEPKPEDLCALLKRVVEYMDNRTSNKVCIKTSLPTYPVMVSLVAPLFEWVIENLCKNAVDAMEGSGTIDVLLMENEKLIVVDVKDTGKGLPKNHFKSVFTPGFTTKKRGWGLGLSLAKRVVEEYHHGRIYVRASEIGVGTTFRIELPKNILV
ncbi:MAG: HAMP domain-containing histidine kinase [Bacteroides sp.]|nr:HAMP domain-containing histidine kinase [Bacteroides sp.]MCM1421604.1 HAMP domain-containing histidine kinase [Bacteroides sp.]